MVNKVQIEQFHSDELSDIANWFINRHRMEWSIFCSAARKAEKENNQDILDDAIDRLVPILIDAGDGEEGGQALWEELWLWFCNDYKRRKAARYKAKISDESDYV